MCASALPGLGFLQCLQSQAASKSWEWLGWKRMFLARKMWDRSETGSADIGHSTLSASWLIRLVHDEPSGIISAPRSRQRASAIFKAEEADKTAMCPLKAHLWMTPRPRS